MAGLINMTTPQLSKIHSGKVRESYRIDDSTRMILVTDRISCFDKILETPVPGKGAILNGIANFWFEQTRSICENHFIEQIHPNISLYRETRPVRVEMIVRAYLTGSAWREYEKGKRTFSGVALPDGMKKNQKLAFPILTPTTKEKSDREITPAEIVETGLATEKTYKTMAEIALRLFEFGTGKLFDRGIILVDTKYEFGLSEGEVVLIDEIHTPDSSRFWSVEEYRRNQGKIESIDKEFVRSWLMNDRIGHELPSVLPAEVVAETTKRYGEIFSLITGHVPPFHREVEGGGPQGGHRRPDGALLADPPSSDEVHSSIYEALCRKKLIKDGYVAIIMGSKNDLPHAKKIAGIIEKFDIMTEFRVVSAHKNGERIPEIASEYNNSIEPGAIIAVAGRSNGLGGALAANLNIPLFNCPPFQDKNDLILNINSSLMMPSNTPAATVIDPESAALAALRSLNLPRLRRKFSEEIKLMKEDLLQSDIQFRENEKC